MIGICKLCKQERELMKSHIIPKFVYRWLISTSATGGLRDSRNPDRRLQDGEKRPLLCAQCEQLFSVDERLFARDFFTPYTKEGITEFVYGEWALRFAVSVVWRVLVYQGDEGLSHLSPQQLEDTRHAERIWREFLLGARHNPRSHRVHVLFLEDVTCRFMDGISPYINRYIARSVCGDVIHFGSEIAVFAKIGRIVLLGFVKTTKKGGLGGTQLRLNEGILDLAKSGKYSFPLFRYMNERAYLGAAMVFRRSERQQSEIEKRMSADLSKTIKSESFRAIEADVALFGREAFNYSPGSDGGTAL